MRQLDSRIADRVEAAQEQVRRLERRLAASQRLLAASKARTTKAERGYQEALHALDGLRRSRSWRLTAPLRSLRRVVRSFIDLVRLPRTCHFELVPNADLVEREGKFIAAGGDPQLELRLVGRAMPRGWMIVIFDVAKSEGMLWPRFYADFGLGYEEPNSWTLPPVRSGRTLRTIHLPARPRRLRLDPAVKPCIFEDARLEARSGGFIWLASLVVIRAIANTRRSPNRRQSVTTAAQSLAFGRWREFVNKLKNRSGLFNGEGDRNYDTWIKLYDRSARAEQAARGTRLAKPPLISILMPVFDPPVELLDAAINSVKAQGYANWELCIADDASTSPAVRARMDAARGDDRRICLTRLERNGGIAVASNAALSLARGDYIALVDHDDLLAEDALAVMAAAVAERPEAILFYSDEDKIDLSGRRYEPCFKPDWNLDLFYSQNYLNHLSLYRRSAILDVGGFREGFDGSQDYDLALRVIERTPPACIRHVPHVLYHWRAAPGSAAASINAKPEARIKARDALQEHFGRTGVAAIVETDLDIFQRVRWPLPKDRPLVSLIIPTRDRLDMLRRCIEGIQKGTDYAPWELIVVDNGSKDRETLDYLAGLGADSRIRLLRDESPFNYAALNNRAAKLARGSLLGFLNDDLAVVGGDWLSEMVSQAVRPDIGAVGARLLYEDGRVQHAGVILGFGGIAGHWHRMAAGDDPGYFGRALLAQELSAVTAACMLVPKSVFERVGGFDAENFAVAFNDIDLCLRIREAGYRIAWTPYATLLHHESASRGREDTREKRMRFARECAAMLARWGDRLRADPFFSPNLSLDFDMPSLAFPPRAAVLLERRASR